MPAGDDGTVVLDARTLGDPLALRQLLGERSPIHRASLPDGMPGWLITGAKEARRALSDPRLVRSNTAAAPELQQFLGLYRDAFLPHSMVFNDRPVHTRMKQVVSRQFTPRAMQWLRPRVQSITDGLLDAITPLGYADVLESLALPLPNAVICEWFGVPVDDRPEFARQCGIVTGIGVTIDEADLMAAGRYFDTYLSDLVAQRRANRGEDLLSEMIGSQETYHLTDVELRSNLFLMLIGSVETAVNMIANGMLALLRNPDALALLRREPHLLPNAVEEILRVDAPVLTVMYHFAAKPLTIADVDIKPGEHVVVSLTAANFDPREFPDPCRFDIQRSTGSHLSFSHGIHFCLGAPLARLEGEIFFSTALDRLHDIELAMPESELSWKPSFLVHRLDRLPIRFTPAPGRPATLTDEPDLATRPDGVAP
jgi:cytochrome P450